MRTGTRWRAVLALILLMPIIEVVIAIWVGGLIGTGATLLSLLGLTVVGIAVIRHQGSRAFADLQSAAREQRRPARDLADRVLVLVGGVLLAAPGFVTAALSVLFLLPFTRPLLRGAVGGWAVRRGSMYVTTQVRPPADGATSRRGPSNQYGDVVRGEVVDDDGQDTAQPEG